MNGFEYLSVFYAIVVSLAITHLLSGIGRMVQATKVRVSLIHAGWVLYMLFQCVDFWFSLWQARTQSVFLTAPVALFVFTVAAALYLASWLVMPEIRPNEPVDLVAFNDANRRKYLGAFMVYSALGAISLVPSGALKAGVWAPVIGVFAAGAAWIWRDRRVQAAALAVIYVSTGLYFFRYIWSL
jgi:hypothetical protein